jgi:plastocyanin
VRARHYPTAGTAALAGVAVLLAACGGGGTKTDIAGVKANDKGVQDVSGMTSLEVEADNFYFKPTVLKGTAGQHLTIRIKNETSTEHNFTVASQNVDKDIEDGKEVTLSVTLPSTGTISFFCKYHKTKGMAGGLQAA